MVFLRENPIYKLDDYLGVALLMIGNPHFYGEPEKS